MLSTGNLTYISVSIKADIHFWSLGKLHPSVYLVCMYVCLPYWLLNPKGTAVSYFVFIIPHYPDTVPGT